MLISKKTRLASIVLLVILLLPAAVSAAPSRQTGLPVLDWLTAMEVVLNDSMPEASATFTVGETYPFSLVARAGSSDLNTTLVITGPGGQVVAEAQPDASAPGVTLIEAILAPATGTYTATVSRVGTTSGTATLQLLPGFGELDIMEDFEAAPSDMNLTWAWYESDFTIQDIVNGQLHMTVLQPSTVTYWTHEDNTAWSDFYMETTAWVDGRPSYWEYGFVLRADWDADAYYMLSISSYRTWSLYLNQADEWIEIQPWTQSPALDITARNPRLGVLVLGNTFRLYFNQQLVGEVSDPNNVISSGRVGYAIGTTDQSDQPNVYFDDLIITVPAGMGDSPILLDEPMPTESASPTEGPLGNLGGAATKTPAPTLGGLGEINLPGRSAGAPERSQP